MHRRTVFWFLVTGNLVLLFFVVHDRWYFEEPEGRFFLAAMDAASLRIGQLAVIATILIGLYAGTVMRGEDLQHKIIMAFRPLYGDTTLGISTVVLILVATGLAGAFLTGPRFNTQISQGGSAVLVTPDGKSIYIADNERGLVHWQDLDAPHAGFQSIRIGQEVGSGWAKGQPTRLAYVPKTDEILVTDTAFNRIVVIDRRSSRVRHVISGVGFAPRFLVVTPDGHKAYVASEQPIPTGHIAVIDLTVRPYPRLLDTKISVPSPQGMAIRGRKLYVATQSGAGNDPVFIVDTSTDTVIEWLLGFAVGASVAVVGPSADKLYVAVNNPYLGVIHVSSRRPKTRSSIPLQFNSSYAITATSDGKTALVLTGSQITAIDTESDKVLGSVQASPQTTGLAVHDNRVYAWFPNVSQLFTFDLRAVVPTH